MSMNVLEKARELGEALYTSAEFEAMKEAQAAMESNEDSSKLLKDLAELEADIRATMEKPEMSELFLQSKMERYQKLQATAAENPMIQAYQVAGNEFQQLMGRVNSIISFFLTGETPDMQASAEGGCSGNCASCAGCHE